MNNPMGDAYPDDRGVGKSPIQQGIIMISTQFNRPPSQEDSNPICFGCRRPMINHDGINFECPRCGSTKYNGNPDRIKELRLDGARDCPVCGRILIYRNGYYTCLKCSADMARKDNPHERWIIRERNSKQNSTILYPALFILCLSFSISPIILLVM
jgi:uncharacterized Zn finger protein (UPF0148 family)